MKRTVARDRAGTCLTTIPSWEEPIHRFFHDGAELQLQIVRGDSDNGMHYPGPVFTLPELLAAPDTLFPICIGNDIWTRDDLRDYAAALAPIACPVCPQCRGARPRSPE